jgi:hypothetical protein
MNRYRKSLIRHCEERSDEASASSVERIQRLFFALNDARENQEESLYCFAAPSMNRPT